jgi:subtilisin family serine protease
LKKRILLIIFLSFIPFLQVIRLDLGSYDPIIYQNFPSHQLLNPPFSTNSIKNIHLSSSFNAGDHIGLGQNVWNSTLTGTNITVAILDTGIYANHSVFTDDGNFNWSKRIIMFYDVITNKTTLPVDDHGHGTWASSILGGNNSEYHGVATNVSFVILKIFDDSGETNASMLIKAIDWILLNKDIYNIRIVSMSFGAKPEADNLGDISKIQDIVAELVDDGILVVAAAGNDGDPTKSYGDGTINAPASERKVLAVGGVDYYGNMYPYSAKGPTFEGVIKPDVCAPAVSVYGADKDYIDDYGFRTGTSGATPFVAGLAALMLEKTPGLDPLQLKNIISLTSIRTIDPTTIKDNIQGWGIIQGYAALSALTDPILINSTTKIILNLNQNKSVFCLPIKLNPNHYFFEIDQTNDTSAEMYLFNNNPDIYGEPILLSHTINPLDDNVAQKRMGILVDKMRDFYLVVKLNQLANGEFIIRLVFEYRNLIIVAFGIINIISLVYISHLSRDYKKRYKN